MSTARHGLRFASPLMAAYISVPRIVMRDTRLSDRARLLYLTLCDYARESDRAYPGQVTIGEHLGCSPKAVGRALRELLELGLVTVQRASRTAPNTYVIAADYAPGRRPGTTHVPHTSVADEGTPVSPRETADEGTDPAFPWGQPCPPNEMQRTSSRAREAQNDDTTHTTVATIVEHLTPLIHAGRIDDPRIDGSDTAIAVALAGPQAHLVDSAIQQIAAWASDQTNPLRRRSVAGLLPSALQHAARRTRRDDGTAEDRPAWETVVETLDRVASDYGRDDSAGGLTHLTTAMPAAAALAVALGWKTWANRPIAGFDGRDFLKNAEKTYRTLDLDPQPVRDHLDLLELRRKQREALDRGENPYDPEHPLNTPNVTPLRRDAA